MKRSGKFDEENTKPRTMRVHLSAANEIEAMSETHLEKSEELFQEVALLKDPELIHNYWN